MIVRVANDDAYEVAVALTGGHTLIVRVSGKDAISAGNDRRSALAGMELMAGAFAQAMREAGIAR